MNRNLNLNLLLLARHRRGGWVPDLLEDLSNPTAKPAVGFAVEIQSNHTLALNPRVRGREIKIKTKIKTKIKNRKKAQSC